MDPITHGIIGMAVSAAGQDSFSFLSPITTAAVLGAIIPDGDILVHLKSESLYLKHHRGVSHSLIGIVFESAVVGLALKAFYSNTSFSNLFLWAFIGALTHILSDILNSYGAKIFWPFSNRMKSLSLLTITDPFVILLFGYSILSSYNKWGHNTYITIGFILYIMSKAAFRLYGHALLKREFKQYNIEKVYLLPSMIAGHKFHYIVENNISRIVGEIDFLLNKVRIIDIFKKIDRETRSHILKSKAAVFFKNFTPIFHIDIKPTKDGYKVILTDLRYILKNKFLHHATIIYDENMGIVDEKFNPYSISKKLDV